VDFTNRFPNALRQRGFPGPWGRLPDLSDRGGFFSHLCAEAADFTAKIKGLFDVQELEKLLVVHPAFSDGHKLLPSGGADGSQKYVCG
jgi:hypothetical protein